ncbi:hypothetical protein OG216_46765 (plasmid) [Streptomycetaceae bacterium NBC_01309]
MASYTLDIGDSTTPVDQQSWQMDGAFCPEPSPAPCGLAAASGTSHWTRTSATTTVRSYTYGCLAGHTWSRDVPGHCTDRPTDNTDADTAADENARFAHA